MQCGGSHLAVDYRTNARNVKHLQGQISNPGPAPGPAPGQGARLTEGAAPGYSARIRWSQQAAEHTRGCVTGCVAREYEAGLERGALQENRFDQSQPEVLRPACRSGPCPLGEIPHHNVGIALTRGRAFVGSATVAAYVELIWKGHDSLLRRSSRFYPP